MIVIEIADSDIHEGDCHRQPVPFLAVAFIDRYLVSPMNDINNSWVYRRLGLRGLRVYSFVWFALIYVFLGVAVLTSVFMPWVICVVCLVLSIAAAGLVTKMYAGLRAEMWKVSMRESSGTETACASSPESPPN